MRIGSKWEQFTNIKNFEPDNEELLWSSIQIGHNFATDKATYAVSYHCPC